MSDEAICAEVHSALTINRAVACLKRSRHNGLTDTETVVAILAVVDSCEASQLANEDDLTTIHRIGHGMQRGDRAYCLAELSKAKRRASA